MKKESLTKNFIFQFFYQIVILVIPLVLSPYLTRILGDTALGTYSYVNSIAYYFVIIAMLGISRHGQRIISENIKDEITLRKLFWSLFFLHIIISLLSLGLYFVISFVFGGNDIAIYLIEGIYVASAVFDITWFFYGLENFKSVVIKNTIIKVLECILIFVLVKSPDDLWIYTLISASGILLGQLVLIPQAIRLAKPIKFSWSDMKIHIKPIFVFFISVLAASLYTVFDKTLLGLMISKESVAYYEYSNKIILIPRTIIAVIGTVMFPRACKMASEGNIEGQKKYIHYSILLTSIISMASIFGLAAVSDQFAVIYYGEAFAQCGKIMVCLSPVIYIVGIGEIFRTQYMIPNHLDKEFTISIVISAILNLILSISLIPILGIYGAVVGTVSAELFGLIFQLIVCKNFIKLKDIGKSLGAFIIIGLIMYFVIVIVARFLDHGIVSLLIQIGLGAMIFMLLTVIYMKLFENEALSIFATKLFKKKVKNEE